MSGHKVTIEYDHLVEITMKAYAQGFTDAQIVLTGTKESYYKRRLNDIHQELSASLGVPNPLDEPERKKTSNNKTVTIS